MKKLYFLVIFIFTFGIVTAQEKLSKEEKERREKNIQAGNPFARFGYKAKVATLSKGKYLEFHDLDSIVTIGSIRFHVDKKQIVGNIVRDTLNPDAQPIGDTAGRWISPDPLSEEFPSWSPYNFVMGNPMRYTDPTGMAPEDIIIIGNKDQKLTYQNGNLLNSDGSAYTGKVDKFTQKTVNALATIGSSKEGAAMINELQSSNNVFTISKGASEFNETDRNTAYGNQLATDPAAKGSFDALTQMGINMTGGSGGSITWNPSGGDIPTTAGMTTNSVMDLGHEMAHALDSNRGMLDNRKENGVKRDEYQAVYRENTIRGQLNLPLRTHYQTTFDANGVKSGYGPSMLNSSNQNVKPSWYK